MGTPGVFQMLEASSEEHKRRKVSFAVACVVDSLVVGLLVLAGVWFPKRPARQVQQYVVLTFSSSIERKPLLRAPAAPRALPRSLTPIVLPAPHVESPKVSEPQIHADITAPSVTDQPPHITQPAIAQPPPVPSPPVPVVHTGVFGQAPGTPRTEKAPIEQVQTGGFGNPLGLAGQAQGGNPGNLPKVGVFDLAGGPGRGNGTAESRGIPQVVADAGFGGRPAETAVTEIDVSDISQRATGAGFGNGGVNVGGNRRSGDAAPSAVKTGAFSTPESAQTPANRQGPSASTPEVRPVEILSKPSPHYTAEARVLGVQGEVVLSVIFRADGTLKVVGVIRSLGHGLDETAKQAATQIRFKPAEQGGKPINFPAVLHIEFRLA
jgi:periplasmic protein TonB